MVGWPAGSGSGCGSWPVAKWHNSDDRVDDLNATAHEDPRGPGEGAPPPGAGVGRRQQQLHLNAK